MNLRRLISAGFLDDELNVQGVVFTQYLFGAVGFLASLLITAAGEMGLLGLAFSVAAGAFAYQLPVRCIKARATRVRRITEGEVLSALSILIMCTRSGLSFNAALELYIKESKTLLSLLLGQVYMAYRYGGSSRKTELSRLAERLDSKELRQLCEAVETATMFGAPLSQRLEALLKDATESKRLRSREHIAKVPVKMLAPMGLCILPAMLVLVLGPVLLSVFGM